VPAPEALGAALSARRAQPEAWAAPVAEPVRAAATGPRAAVSSRRLALAGAALLALAAASLGLVTLAARLDPRPPGG